MEAIRKRRSIRAYLKKAVEEDKLKEILKAAMCAPNSWGTKPWEFIVVRENDKRASLSKATGHALFVKNAPAVIVVCYDTAKGKRFKEDSSIAAAHIQLEAVNQGLGSCFVQIADAGEPAGSAEPYVARLLNVPQGRRIQCMVSVGYPKRAMKEHTDAVYDPAKVHFEKF